MKVKKMLLIDNSEIDNFVNVTLLSGSGLAEDFVSVSSAREGLAHLQKVADKPGEIPELILLDLGMQLMDGFGFLEEFVKLPSAISQYTRIIVLTSSIDPKDKTRSLSFPPVIDLMEKPLNVEKLRGLLNGQG